MAVGTVILATAACLLPEDPVLDHLWEGRIVALDGAPTQVQGLAQMVGQGGVTRVWLGVLHLTGADLPTSLAWRLREGRCAASGDPVMNPDALPRVPLSGPRGGGDVEVTFGSRLSVHIPHAVEVFASTEPSGTPIGCANLIRMQ